MSITLALRGTGQESAKLTLEGPRIVLGRGPGSDVRIPDASVSHRHATIRAERSDYVLVDEGSVNGTWVGGVRLSPGAPRLLRNGDLMRIGRIWIEVRFDAAVPTQDLANATRDLAFALVAGALESLGDDVTTRVRIVEGLDTGEELRLDEDNRSYVIGRGDDCDLVLSDQDSSRRHLLVTRRASLVYVQDLGSKNGVMLGEQRIQPGRDVPWRSHTMLKLARTVLALEEPVALALRDIESQGDEALSEAELSAPPPAEAPALRPQLAETLTSQEAPASTGPPSSHDASAAPIAFGIASGGIAPPPIAPLVARGKKSALSGADWAIVAAAAFVLVTSLVGLFFLLRG